MSGNIFGSIFKLTTFGESHGPSIGGVIDGCPSGIEINIGEIQKDLDRRKPGQSSIVTQRKDQMKSAFILEFLKVKLQELQLVLQFIIEIKNLKIILI